MNLNFPSLNEENSTQNSYNYFEPQTTFVSEFPQSYPTHNSTLLLQGSSDSALVPENYNTDPVQLNNNNTLSNILAYQNHFNNPGNFWGEASSSTDFNNPGNFCGEASNATDFYSNNTYFEPQLSHSNNTYFEPQLSHSNNMPFELQPSHSNYTYFELQPSHSNNMPFELQPSHSNYIEPRSITNQSFSNMNYDDLTSSVPNTLNTMSYNVNNTSSITQNISYPDNVQKNINGKRARNMLTYSEDEELNVIESARKKRKM